MPSIDAIKPDLIDADLRQIIEAAPLPGLDENPRSDATKSAIDKWRQAGDGGGTLVESGLWLLAGELDRSHTISQSFESADGSYWHGIMHRREGDYGNSKYWFRRVGTGHAVHRELGALLEQRQAEFNQVPVQQLFEPKALGGTLVDLCQMAMGSESAWQPELKQICWWEWQLLFAKVTN